MPHKKNPVGLENLTGVARLLRGYLQPALEDIALWHERDISHSSVERVILPDATTLAHYALRRLKGILEGLEVFEENLARNLDLTRGLVYSQQVLNALIARGLSRDKAYALVRAIPCGKTGVQALGPHQRGGRLRAKPGSSGSRETRSTPSRRKGGFPGRKTSTARA